MNILTNLVRLYTEFRPAGSFTYPVNRAEVRNRVTLVPGGAGGMDGGKEGVVQEVSHPVGRD